MTAKRKRGKTDNDGQFLMSTAQADKTIPKSDIEQGPEQVLLWKVNKVGCVLTLRSFKVDPTEPILAQVKKWAGENGWDVVEHREEPGMLWAAITTLVNRSEPWAGCYKLRSANLAPATSLGG